MTEDITGHTGGHAGAPAEPPTPVASADTPQDKKQRKPRSDKGKKRQGAPPLAKVEDWTGPSGAGGLPVEEMATTSETSAAEWRVTPKPKRQRRGYIVAADYETYATLDAARRALGTRMAERDGRLEGAEGDPPALIVGRVLKTKYVPAKAIPPTVIVVG